MSNLGPFSRGIQDYAKVKRDRDKYELKSTLLFTSFGMVNKLFYFSEPS